MAFLCLGGQTLCSQSTKDPLNRFISQMKIEWFMWACSQYWGLHAHTEKAWFADNILGVHGQYVRPLCAASLIHCQTNPRVPTVRAPLLRFAGSRNPPVYMSVIWWYVMIPELIHLRSSYTISRWEAVIMKTCITTSFKRHLSWDF